MDKGQILAMIRVCRCEDFDQGAHFSFLSVNSNKNSLDLAGYFCVSTNQNRMCPVAGVIRPLVDNKSCLIKMGAETPTVRKAKSERQRGKADNQIRKSIRRQRGIRGPGL